MDEGDLDLSVWVNISSECPLTSDDSADGSPKGCLTLADHHDNDDVEESGHPPDDQADDEVADELLQRLAGRHDDFLSTVKSRYRFSCLTELDVTEQCVDPEIIRATTSVSTWPCDVIRDSWFKLKVYFARRCKLPCCQEYTWPQEWARRRQFSICKRHYLVLPGLTSRESDAILRWSDLVTTQEWREGGWSDRGVLTLSDSTKFPMAKITWSAMEEHLAALAYNDKQALVFLAARICMEALAKNKAMYSYSQQYWGFARICTDLLKSPFIEVQEGILLSLQLYLRTLKIFHSCFSHKCTEYASAGLFPVLLDLLDKSSPNLQAVVVNILILMGMHAPYITLLTNMGGLSALVKLTNTSHDLLRRRVHSCLEIIAKHPPAQQQLIEEGVLPLAVRHFTPLFPTAIQLNCLFLLNSLCHNRTNLIKTLAVENYLVVKSVIRVLSEWTSQFVMSATRTQSLSITQIQNWCTLPRQNLILLCKLCVDETACKFMVKRGVVLKLKGVWYTCDTETDRTLVMEALAIMSRFPRPAEKLCYEGFLTCLTDALNEQEHREQVLEVVANLGKKHLPQMFEAGLMQKLVLCFGDKVFARRLYPSVLSILAAYSSIDKVRDLLLENEGKAYTLVLDTAFLTSDFTVLQSCITIVSKLSTAVVPLELLKSNTLLLVAYIDKLLKTGPDGLVLHGLMQLQDYLKVDQLFQSFREHHTYRVVEILCNPPYKPPVQYMAGRVLEILTGVRRRSSNFDDHHEVSTQSFDLAGDKSNKNDECKRTERVDKKDSISDSFQPAELETVMEKLLPTDDEVFEEADELEKDKQATICEASIRLNIISATDDEDENDDDVANKEDEFEMVRPDDHDDYTMLQLL